MLKVTGLQQLREKLDVFKGEPTRKRRQEEATVVRDYAKSISPVRTGAFQKGWRFRTGKRVIIEVYNEVDYSPYVHAAGDPTLIVDLVREFAQERAPQLAEDMAQIVSNHINGR